LQPRGPHLRAAPGGPAFASDGVPAPSRQAEKKFHQLSHAVSFFFRPPRSPSRPRRARESLGPSPEPSIARRESAETSSSFGRPPPLRSPALARATGRRENSSGGPPHSDRGRDKDAAARRSPPSPMARRVDHGPARVPRLGLTPSVPDRRLTGSSPESPRAEQPPRIRVATVLPSPAAHAKLADPPAARPIAATPRGRRNRLLQSLKIRFGRRKRPENPEARDRRAPTLTMPAPFEPHAGPWNRPRLFSGQRRKRKSTPPPGLEIASSVGQGIRGLFPAAAIPPRA